MTCITYLCAKATEVNISGGLRTGTSIPEHGLSCNFSHHISRILHDMDKKVSPEDRPTHSNHKLNNSYTH